MRNDVESSRSIRAEIDLDRHEADKGTRDDRRDRSEEEKGISTPRRSSQKNRGSGRHPASPRITFQMLGDRIMPYLRRKGKNWYYTITDIDGRQRERKGCANKRFTEEMAAEEAAEIARRKLGLFDEKTERYLREGKRPLLNHIQEYYEYLIAQGNTRKYADQTLEACRRIAGLLKNLEVASIDPPKTIRKEDRERLNETIDHAIKQLYLSDLTVESVQQAIAKLKDAGKSLRTCNRHRQAIRGFSSWAWKTGRLVDHPLLGVTGFNQKEDRRHDRRTISLDELNRLIAAAHDGPRYQRMTGPARSLCYRLAVCTGLRYAEIASLTKLSFDLDHDPPLVRVAASYTKNGEAAEFDLPPDLAVDMADWIASIEPGDRVFELPDKGAKMLRVDLELAGIPYIDAAGFVFDFHSLRCQYATLLDLARVPSRVIQAKMRHSTMELTSRYIRPRSFDMLNATAVLPSLRPGGSSKKTEPSGGESAIG